MVKLRNFHPRKRALQHLTCGFRCCATTSFLEYAMAIARNVIS
jgi:hypothetical protein